MAGQSDAINVLNRRPKGLTTLRKSNQQMVVGRTKIIGIPI